jgi:hypothetical protein
MSGFYGVWQAAGSGAAILAAIDEFAADESSYRYRGNATVRAYEPEDLRIDHSA